VLSLLDVISSEHLGDSTEGDDRYRWLTEMILLVTDSLMVVWRPAEAGKWLERIREHDAWDRLTASRGGQELEPALVALGPGNSEEGIMPPVALLQDLIAAKCSRAATYLVLLWCFKAEHSEWPEHSVIACIELVFKACIATWNVILARAFYLYLSWLRTTGTAAMLYADQSGDLSRVNGMVASLEKQGCDVMFDSASDWREVIMSEKD